MFFLLIKGDACGVHTITEQPWSSNQKKEKAPQFLENDFSSFI